MDWAQFSSTYETITVMPESDRLDALARLEESDEAFASRLRRQIELENVGVFMATSAPAGIGRDAEFLESGTRVGAWRIDSVLGIGGMGAVYRVTRDDGTFEQTAALKTLRRSNEALSVRFENERRRLALLEHPNIARIIDGGTGDGGHPFMVVELVEGQPVDHWAAGKSQAQKISLLRQLCSALAHAHARLVLHRDIQPGNVLVNDQGDVRLIDFGIAELVDTEASSGPGPLTLAVAAPEQLEGGQITTATDVFQVGMLAHRILADTWPKRQSDGGVELDEDRISDPDLRAILARTTSTDPRRRYDSVDALGEDLERYLLGFPVTARPVSSMIRFRKAVARNKLASGMSAVTIAALFAAIIGVSTFAVRANNAAEANRVTQEKGARQIELYETFNAGFAEFVASLDMETVEGQAIIKALKGMEKAASSLEQTDPQRAAETYVFLSEVYGDAGMDRDASRIATKLASQRFKPSYPIAYTLSNVVHLSQGFVEDDQLIEWLDRAEKFFSKKPKVNSFDIAVNRCVKSRLTGTTEDSQRCIDLVEKQLNSSKNAAYATKAANLTLQAYAMQSAISLGDFDKADQIGQDALAFIRSEDRPVSVHEADFLLQMSDIAQARREWGRSREFLLQARLSLKGNPELSYLEIDCFKELAETEIAMGAFGNARLSASRAVTLAEKVYGPDHFQSRDAKANLAKALSGGGDHDRARTLIAEIIQIEKQSDNDPVALKKYRAIEAAIPGRASR